MGSLLPLSFAANDAGFIKYSSFIRPLELRRAILMPVAEEGKASLIGQNDAPEESVDIFCRQDLRIVAFFAGSGP